MTTNATRQFLFGIYAKNAMLRKGLYLLVAVLALLIGLYPAAYVLTDMKQGLLGSKPAALLANPFWQVGFYTHISFGGVSLLIGWLQFNKRLLHRQPLWHRRIGKAYVVSVLLSAAAGIGIGFFATGGLIPATGFVSLGVFWFTTTLFAYLRIRQRRIEAHQRLMLYSYAACFAGVTLRLQLPFLITFFGSFAPAYALVAWSCWLPNLVVAWWLTRSYPLLDKFDANDYTTFASNL